MADHSHSPLLTNASKGAIQLFTSNKSATATAVGTVILPDMAGCYCKDAVFEYITNGTETVQVFGSYDGTNFSSALVPFDVATGLPAANAVLEEGAYILPRTWNFNHYKFTGSSTSDIKTIAFAAVIVPK
jgi:hypothetical protein